MRCAPQQSRFVAETRSLDAACTHARAPAARSHEKSKTSQLISNRSTLGQKFLGHQDPTVINLGLLLQNSRFGAVGLKAITLCKHRWSLGNERSCSNEPTASAIFRHAFSLNHLQAEMQTEAKKKDISLSEPSNALGPLDCVGR